MIRTRFAPSPTGFLHVGGLRTALYSYLYAKKYNGSFILRIEDTDQTRYVKGATEHLIKILEQIGLKYDEGPEKGGEFGPYIQSERTEIYRKYADQLLSEKHAYRCFCTPEQLNEMRERQILQKKAPMYDRTCLYLSDKEIEEKLNKKTPFTIRQKIPHGQILKFQDQVRGTVKFDTSTVDDQVLMKSDNFPTYHLANVVDDHLMEISNVIRGEEWLSSTPKHILLYQAFGWEPPKFAHIPLLLSKDRSKLSKRQNDVSVESYLKAGYLKEAIINFISFLGWHPGDGVEKEIFTLKELIDEFSIEKVHKSGAIFDTEKLNWFNFKWTKELYRKEIDSLAKQIEDSVTILQEKEHKYIFKKRENKTLFNKKRAEILLNRVKNYIKTENIPSEKTLLAMEEKILKDPTTFEEETYFIYKIKNYDKELFINEKMDVDFLTAKTAIKHCIEITSFLTEEEAEDLESIQTNILKEIKAIGFKNGQILWPLRVALSGEKYSQGAFELIWILGKKEVEKRLKEALKKLEQ